MRPRTPGTVSLVKGDGCYSDSAMLPNFSLVYSTLAVGALSKQFYSSMNGADCKFTGTAHRCCSRHWQVILTDFENEGGTWKIVFLMFFVGYLCHTIRRCHLQLSSFLVTGVSRILRRTSRYDNSSLVPLALAQHVAILFQRATYELSLFPQIWREETVCTSDGAESGLECVLERLCRAR